MANNQDGNKPQDWADVIREAIGASELTRAEIARQAEMTEGNLSYFMANKRGINLATAQRLAQVVGLKIVAE